MRDLLGQLLRCGGEVGVGIGFGGSLCSCGLLVELTRMFGIESERARCSTACRPVDLDPASVNGCFCESGHSLVAASLRRPAAVRERVDLNTREDVMCSPDLTGFTATEQLLLSPVAHHSNGRYPGR